MLIQFSVANFRSIREEQTLHLVAGEDDELPENVIAPQTRGDYSLLRSCGIFGANASGKSNLLLAMHTMREIVTSSASWQLGTQLPVTPFLLHSAAAAQPSEFAIHFIAEGERYQYGFAATPSAITEEWLYAYPNGERQKWFERELQDGGAYKWTWGDQLPNDKQTWQRATRDNALFLSTATLLNSAKLRPVYDWFQKKLGVFGLGFLGESRVFPIRVTAERLQTAQKPDIMHMMKSAGIPVDDLNLVEEKFDARKLPHYYPPEYRAKAEQQMTGQPTQSVYFSHSNEKNDRVNFRLEDESGGTRGLFSLCAMWLDALQRGLVLIIDEFNLNLHPDMARFLVDMFHNPDINRSNAQLVFAIHDITLLSPCTMRRDQIWFCEKKDKETRLFPMSDFVLTDEENINREAIYLAGQFGAVPFITDFDAGRPE